MSGMKTRIPHALFALAALSLAACGPTTPVGNNVVSATPSATTSAAAKVTPADFKLGAKILEQSCFGDAGCNVTWRVQVLKAPLTGSWEVTYDIPGVKDGPKSGTVQIADGRVEDEVLTEDFGQFKRRVKSVPVVVTSIEAR